MWSVIAVSLTHIPLSPPTDCLSSAPLCSHHLSPIFFSSLCLAHLIFMPSYFHPCAVSSFENFHFLRLIKILFFSACDTPPSSSYTFCFPLSYTHHYALSCVIAKLQFELKKKKTAIKERHDGYCFSVFACLFKWCDLWLFIFLTNKIGLHPFMSTDIFLLSIYTAVVC